MQTRRNVSWCRANLHRHHPSNVAQPLHLSRLGRKQTPKGRDENVPLTLSDG